MKTFDLFSKKIYNEIDLNIKFSSFMFLNCHAKIIRNMNILVIVNVDYVNINGNLR